MAGTFPQYTTREFRTLSGDLAMDWDTPDILILDAGGTIRNLTLPDASTSHVNQSGGASWLIYNAGGEDINIAANQWRGNINLRIAPYETAIIVYLGVEKTYGVPGNTPAERARNWLVGVLYKGLATEGDR
jgi:hypothetical protein